MGGGGGRDVGEVHFRREGIGKKLCYTNEIKITWKELYLNTLGKCSRILGNIEQGGVGQYIYFVMECTCQFKYKTIFFTDLF